jgi:hypothetical protein
MTTRSATRAALESLDLGRIDATGVCSREGHLAADPWCCGAPATPLEMADVSAAISAAMVGEREMASAAGAMGR